MMRKLSLKNYSPSSIYIVGGGPSLAGFNPSRLRGRFTIGCNDAAIFAETLHLVSMDRGYIDQAKQRSFKDYAGQLHFALSPGYDTSGLPPHAAYLRVRSTGLAELPGDLGGNCSGFAALNLAYHLRPKTIHLLGFDMKPNGHWHESKGRQVDGLMKQWAAQFDYAARALHLMGIEVINYCPDSAIKNFRKASLDDLL